MAVTQNTLIGKSRGSVGGTTFTKWKGLNILKAKAQNNYTNPTTTQVNNNSKFAVMQAFMKSIAVFIVAGFKAMAVNMTEYNAFSQANKYSEVIGGPPGSYMVEPADIVISKGPESQNPILSATKSTSNANTIDVNWIDDGITPADTLVYVAAFNGSTGEYIIGSTTPDNYSTEVISLEATGIGTAIATTVIHIFYVNPATGKACDSFIVPSA